MENTIRFDKSFDLAPGKVEDIAPGVRRLLAPNPGPFTFKGTVSYIVGRGQVADPAPLEGVLPLLGPHSCAVRVGAC